MKTVDLNCDMGEGISNDELIMPFISSANIACGYHAGDEATMKRTIALAMRHHVMIGAHPSYDDKDNFGRTDMHLPPSEVYDLVTKQINLLENFAREAGTTLHHVKPHGALYNMAARGKKLAAVIALAVKDVNEKLILYGLSGSHLVEEAKAIGLKTASEVFSDRTYKDDGSLTSRSYPNAMILEEYRSVQQVLQIVVERKVTTVSGNSIPLDAETICIHGDATNAVLFAKKINEALKENKIVIKAIQ